MLTTQHSLNIQFMAADDEKGRVIADAIVAYAETMLPKSYAPGITEYRFHEDSETVTCVFGFATDPVYGMFHFPGDFRAWLKSNFGFVRIAAGLVTAPNSED